MIKDFQSAKWVDIPNWDKELEELANRRKITTTRTVPKTTGLGKFFAISVLLVPLGSALITAALEQGITFDLDLPTSSISVKFILGLLFILAPFLTLAGNWIRLKFRKNDNNTKGKPKNEEAELSNWAFLTGNAISETKTDTTETPEPTSIEFEHKFRKLMQEGLSDSQNRKFLLILDNLDRIEPRDALTIWATLQTFLHDANSSAENWFTKLWIVVPFDPNGLRRLWDKNTNPNDEEGKVEEDQLISDSFIDKNFLIRFEVAPPILSNWKAYLMQLLEAALPKHSADSHIIYHIYNNCRRGELPTPRELKLFINQIGAIHRQWQDQFPISHVAYYVALRRKNK